MISYEVYHLHMILREDSIFAALLSTVRVLIAKIAFLQSNVSPLDSKIAAMLFLH